MLTRQRQRWEGRVLQGNRTAYAKALWQREHRWEELKKGSFSQVQRINGWLPKGRGWRNKQNRVINRYRLLVIYKSKS